MNKGFWSGIWSGRVVRKLLFISVAVLGVVSIIASGGGGGGDDDGDGDGDGVHAFNFTLTNMVDAVQISIAVPDMFPGFSDVTVAIMGAVEGGGLTSNIPVDIDLCSNAPTGTATLTWVDNDSSGDMSAGDTISMAISSCDLGADGSTVSGSIEMGFSVVDIASLPRSFTASIDIDVDILDAGDTIGFVGHFILEAYTGDDTSFTFSYTGADPDGLLTASLNSQTIFKFGCFSVNHTFSTADPEGTYGLAVNGVVNAVDNIMSLAGGPALSFLPYPSPGGSYLDAGQKRLLSFAAPECAAVDVPTGVGDSDGNYIDIIATGGGNLTLELHDSSDTLLNAIYTTWDVLY